MTRRYQIALASAAASCAAVAAFSLHGETVPAPSRPCSGVVNGQPDPIIRIEVAQYTRWNRQSSLSPCSDVLDATTLTQADSLLRASAMAWQRLDKKPAAFPNAKFTFVRRSGTRDEVVLADSRLISVDWALALTWKEYLLFDNMIVPVYQISPPPRSYPSPLTWLLQVVCR